MPAPCNQSARYSSAFVATCSRSMLCACPMALAVASACFVSILMPALYPSRWYEFKAGFGCQAGTHPGLRPPLQGGELFYPLLGGVPRSGGVGLTDGRTRNPPRPSATPPGRGWEEEQAGCPPWECGLPARKGKNRQARCLRSQEKNKRPFFIPSLEGCRVAAGWV